MDPRMMHQKLHQAWSPYFCLDKEEEDQHPWEEAVSFLEAILNFPIMSRPLLAGQQLYLAVNKNKTGK